MTAAAGQRGPARAASQQASFPSRSPESLDTNGVRTHKLAVKQGWRVTIPEHDIERRTIGGTRLPGTYRIDAHTAIQLEPSRASAIEIAARAAHARADVPPWLPYLRETIQLAQAQRCMVEL